MPTATGAAPSSWRTRGSPAWAASSSSRRSADARDFSMEELDTWNYYVPEDREGFEWHLYYAFLIVSDNDHTVAERAGLAKIHRRAFDLASLGPGKV
ncbi:uncharacterized protein ColSpa_00999 [Colletotrichum spaethianum]|uniref:Uncharacterized protein n=1 Tax=Colletotrichum spaethianum TaxID=700344 RepID=A0AA37L716_9PEZI|nr:uncharacterized protein ColSpa_00999 [Colletotrichum spaethianum]GKT40818.1 hypothetical protein ColSpa_00999 [Colletotrichum spaethianum]